MRVFALCKRQYTGKDLLDDRYGRLFELPAALAARGHEVFVFAHSYRSRGPLRRTERRVQWQSVDVWPRCLHALRAQMEETDVWKPDLIWASSDALSIVAGDRLARRLGIPTVLDFYDDYEAFSLTRIPPLRRLLRQACARAGALSVVSHSLKDILRERGPLPSLVDVIVNGVPDGFVSSMSRLEARNALGLPATGRLVGTAGALDESRGIEDLFRVVPVLQAHDPDLRLIVAGPRSSAVLRALPPDTIDLGVLPHESISMLFRALDVGVVCNRDSAFGRACNPQKLVEMLACDLPVVAAAVGDVSGMLEDRPNSLYTPGDVGGLANCILAQINRRDSSHVESNLTWGAIGERLARLLDAVLDDTRRSERSQ